MAFVLREHTSLKIKNNKVEYGKIILDSIEAKLSYWFDKEKKRLPQLLRVSNIESFIEYKLLSPKLIYDRITSFELM